MRGSEGKWKTTWMGIGMHHGETVFTTPKLRHNGFTSRSPKLPPPPTPPLLNVDSWPLGTLGQWVWTMTLVHLLGSYLAVEVARLAGELYR